VWYQNIYIALFDFVTKQRAAYVWTDRQTDIITTLMTALA